MKISTTKLREIIEEEVGNLEETHGDPTEFEEEEMDPNPPMVPRPGKIGKPAPEESLETFIYEELFAVLKEYTEVDPIGRAQQRLDRVPFMEWIAQVEELGFQFGEDSPNPYDAWLLSSTPQDYVQQGGVELEEEKAKNNPWAICTAEVGREDKEKYERCVKSVKKGD